MEEKTTIIWDWNGTLLNDVEICVKAINLLLSHRGIPTISVEKYREVFTFPVIDYYRAVGFDFDTEPFEKPAMEFIDEYHRTLHQASLFQEVVSVLTHFNEKGIQQVVLSAMEHDSLMKSLSSNGILPYFEKVSGLNDHYAHGKVELGLQLLDSIDMPKDQLVMVGDTLHDKEVADCLGIDVVLVASGHQSKQRLMSAGVPVLDSISQLEEVVTFQ